MKYATTFGAQMKKFRSARGISQQEMANMLSGVLKRKRPVSKRSVIRWEAGRDPSDSVRRAFEVVVRGVDMVIT